MMMAEVAAFDNLEGLAQMGSDLAAYVRRAVVEGVAADEAEADIWRRILAMGRQAYGQFLAGQGDGDVGETIDMDEGKELRRLTEPHTRTYRSIFGPFELSRFVYGTREGQRIEFVPLDARLKLPESEFSYVLQDWAGTHFVEEAFDRSAETLGKILGFSLSVDSLERMSRKMAESVADFRQSLPKPPADEEGEILVATADGKGIPMRRPADQRPVGARRRKGEKANKKQMATLGCVYTVDPKHRTADDVVEALFRERVVRQPKETAEPVAQHKRLCSSLTYEQGGVHVDAETEVFTWMANEMDARRRKGQPVICLMDGQRSLWASCAAYLPSDGLVEILDLLHAIEYLWKAAYLFHNEGSTEASKFVRDRILRLLHGEVGYVVGGLRQMGTKRKLPGKKQAALDRICNYLDGNRHRMCYDEYLEAGYPIASGVIEGACRHLVKDRMERSGMRWTIDGAQAMLDLRSTEVNGQWSAFCNYRIQTETKRLHPKRQRLEQLTFQLTLQRNAGYTQKECEAEYTRSQFLAVVGDGELSIRLAATYRETLQFQSGAHRSFEIAGIKWTRLPNAPEKRWSLQERLPGFDPRQSRVLVASTGDGKTTSSQQAFQLQLDDRTPIHVLWFDAGSASAETARAIPMLCLLLCGVAPTWIAVDGIDQISRDKSDIWSEVLDRMQTIPQLTMLISVRSEVLGVEKWMQKLSASLGEAHLRPLTEEQIDDAFQDKEVQLPVPTNPSLRACLRNPFLFSVYARTVNADDMPLEGSGEVEAFNVIEEFWKQRVTCESTGARGAGDPTSSHVSKRAAISYLAEQTLRGEELFAASTDQAPVANGVEMLCNEGVLSWHTTNRVRWSHAWYREYAIVDHLLETIPSPCPVTLGRAICSISSDYLARDAANGACKWLIAHPETGNTADYLQLLYENRRELAREVLFDVIDGADRHLTLAALSLPLLVEAIELACQKRATQWGRQVSGLPDEFFSREGGSELARVVIDYEMKVTSSD